MPYVLADIAPRHLTTDAIYNMLLATRVNPALLSFFEHQHAVVVVGPERKFQKAKPRRQFHGVGGWIYRDQISGGRYSAGLLLLEPKSSAMTD